MPARFAQPLTGEQVELVHEAALEILENLSLFGRDDHFRQAIPPTFTFHGRNPLYDHTIPGDVPLVITDRSAPDAQLQARQQEHAIDNPTVFSPIEEVPVRAKFESLVTGNAIAIDTRTNSRI